MHSRNLTEPSCPLVLSLQQALGWLKFLMSTSCKHEDSCLKKTSPNSSWPGAAGAPNIFCVCLMADHNSHTLRCHLSVPGQCSKYSHPCSCTSRTTSFPCHFKLSFLNILCPPHCSSPCMRALPPNQTAALNCTQPPNFSYFNPVFCALMYRHFRETPRHDDLPERMWEAFPHNVVLRSLPYLCASNWGTPYAALFCPLCGILSKSPCTFSLTSQPTSVCLWLRVIILPGQFSLTCPWAASPSKFPGYQSVSMKASKRL